MWQAQDLTNILTHFGVPGSLRKQNESPALAQGFFLTANVSRRQPTATLFFLLRAPIITHLGCICIFKKLNKIKIATLKQILWLSIQSQSISQMSHIK